MYLYIYVHTCKIILFIVFVVYAFVCGGGCGGGVRSEERRVGKECRSRWSSCDKQTKRNSKCREGSLI